MSIARGSLNAALQSRFLARSDRWVTQDADGRYIARRGLLSTPEITRHLAGATSLCSYCLVPAADNEPRALWGALDLDAEVGEDGAASGLPDSVRRALISRAGVLAGELARIVGPESVVCEATGGRGLHVWALMGELVPAGRLLALMDAALAAAGLGSAARNAVGGGLAVERFPKQASLAPGGVGTALRLPLGAHPRTRRRSVFLDPATGVSLDPRAVLLAPDLRLPDADRLAELLDQAGVAAPASPIGRSPSSPAPLTGPHARTRTPGDRRVRPDAWRTYRWAATRLGLSDRTTRSPPAAFDGRGYPVRCLFPAAHAHGDREPGSAYLIRRGDLQLYGCSVCEGGMVIDTIGLVRRLAPELQFAAVLDVCHAIDPDRCQAR